jgi:hypothetical protein
MIFMKESLLKKEALFFYKLYLQSQTPRGNTGDKKEEK